MNKTYTPKTGTGFDVYLLSVYPYFMQEVRGATPVNSLYIIEQPFLRKGHSVYHVEPEGVTVMYESVENSNGDRSIQLQFHGSRHGITSLRKRLDAKAQEFTEL